MDFAAYFARVQHVVFMVCFLRYLRDVLLTDMTVHKGLMMAVRSSAMNGNLWMFRRRPGIHPNNRHANGTGCDELARRFRHFCVRHSHLGARSMILVQNLTIEEHSSEKSSHLSLYTRCYLDLNRCVLMRVDDAGDGWHPSSQPII
jgi:hypothetical protein